MRISHLLALALAPLALAGCGGGGDTGGTTAPPPVDNTPATITLSPAGTLTIAAGATATLTANVATKSGKALGSAGVSWTSADASIAAVTGGVVTGAKVGSTIITAAIGGLTATAPVTVTLGPATVLVLRTQPVGAVIGSPLATQPVVEIRDAGGNLVTTSTASVTVAIATGGGTLSGTTTVAAVGGVATFTGLAIAGTAGDRTLTFSSTGLTSATSSSFTMTAPAVPVIAVSNTAVTFNTPRGLNPANVTLNVTNAGTQTLSGITLDAVTYDSGQPTGWLTATLNTPTAPATITLAVNASALVEGTYHATFRVNAAAANNSPVTVGVTLTVTPGYTVNYGTATEKVKVVDIAGTFAPVVSVVDQNNGAVPGVAITYTSRASSVATVAADGRITARSAGDAWIIATAAFSTDSVFVIVPQSATAPMIRTSSNSFATKVGDTLFVSVVLDTRGTTVGAGSFAVGINVFPISYLYAAPATSPAPVVNAATTSNIRMSVASASGMTGTVALLNLKIIGRTAGTTGYLYFFALDVSGVDGTDLTSQTTSTRLPILFR